MEIETYLKQSEKTLSSNFNADPKTQKILHGVIGISTEAGELLDSVKKNVFYNKALDEVNVKEEIGDLMWYVAILLRELNIKFEDVLENNIAKLRARYGEKFDEYKADNRDLAKERSILENKS